MRKTLYLHFILGYIIFGFLSFLVINQFGKPVIFDHLVKKESRILYDNANIVAYQYTLNDFSNAKDTMEFLTLVRTISQSLDTQIWVIDTNGKVLIDSTKYHNTENTIQDFDPLYFGKGYYRIGNFFNCFSSDVLSVYLPITGDYTTIGYVVLHTSIEVINEELNYFLNLIYKIFLMIFIISFIILIIFTKYVYRPVKEINKAVKEYSKGNFAYDGLKIKSKNEIGEMAASIQLMVSELSTLKEDQNKFIANVSHDFRSPLTSIKGYIEAMKDGTIPPEMQAKYFDTVLFETARLNKLTSNILSLNTGENGFNSLNRMDFDINTIIKDIIETFEGICLERKIKFNITFGDKSYFVNADIEKIQRVLYNLIDNAIKFSRDESEIKISVSDKHEKVFVSIKDFGVGIPKENLNNIWDRFFKTDLSRGKDRTGTGLGLSIAKEIILLHNENIEVFSTERVGTEFIFTLQKSKKKA